MGHVGDDLESISAALERCGPRTDLILTTGGVSVGQKDLLEAAAGHFGARIVFHGISMKPGMPTLFAVKGTRLLLGLSGNPFSAAVAFELLVPPMLAKMTRDTALHLRRERVRTGNFLWETQSLQAIFYEPSAKMASYGCRRNSPTDRCGA